jgi:cellulose synthase/poly-beta-1,6-N-acetylglucosamine synthase-like glycosyltransferase
VTQLFNEILQHYTWAGVALMGVILVLFFVQLYYYLIAYYRIYRFRLMRRKRRRLENPPVSVIVAVRGENERFLTDELPVLLNQQYPHYEVVVVYIGGDVEYYEELQNIRNNYSYMRLTKMGGNDRIYISTKQALNVGIKSAQYEALLFTIPGAMPKSDEWVTFMAKGFEYGEVVVGSSIACYEQDNVRNYLKRMVEMHNMRNAMASAVQGKFFYAPRCNYGFTKSLYESTRGYNYLGIDIGDNDLYLQDIASPERLAVVLSPRAIVEEQRPEGWREWLEHMRYYGSTVDNYSAASKLFMRRERGSRVLFFLSSIVAIVVLPLEVKIVVASMMLLRYLVVLLSSYRVGRKLGERGIASKYWIYDIVGPVIEWVIGSHDSYNTPKIWR